MELVQLDDFSSYPYHTAEIPLHVIYIENLYSGGNGGSKFKMDTGVDFKLHMVSVVTWILHSEEDLPTILVILMATSSEP